MDAAVAGIVGALIGLSGGAITALVSVTLARMSDRATRDVADQQAREKDRAFDEARRRYFATERKEAYVAYLSAVADVRYSVSSRLVALEADRKVEQMPPDLPWAEEFKQLARSRSLVELLGDPGVELLLETVFDGLNAASASAAYGNKPEHFKNAWTGLKTADDALHRFVEMTNSELRGSQLEASGLDPQLAEPDALL